LEARTRENQALGDEVSGLVQQAAGEA